MNGAGKQGDLREGSGAGRQGDPNVFDGSGRDGSKPPQEKFEEGGEGNGGSATLSMCPNCHTKHIVGQSCPTFPFAQIQEEYMKKPIQLKGGAGGEIKYKLYDLPMTPPTTQTGEKQESPYVWRCMCSTTTKPDGTDKQGVMCMKHVRSEITEAVEAEHIKSVLEGRINELAGITYTMKTMVYEQTMTLKTQKQRDEHLDEVMAFRRKQSAYLDKRTEELDSLTTLTKEEK